jgi:hypothetical protein
MRHRYIVVISSRSRTETTNCFLPVSGRRSCRIVKLNFREKPNNRCRVQRLGQMAARCLNPRRLPGRRLRPPSGRYRSLMPLLCYPFLRRARWREVSPRPGQRPILHSAFRTLPDRPKSRFLCRCCKRSSYSYRWVVANSSFRVAAGGARPKKKHLLQL